MPGIAKWVPAQCRVLFGEEQTAMVSRVEEMGYRVAQRDGRQRAACRPNGAPGEMVNLRVCVCLSELLTFEYWELFPKSMHFGLSEG